MGYWDKVVPNCKADLNINYTRNNGNLRTGRHQLRVRCVDLAGNMDSKVTADNSYVWQYRQPLPVAIIVSTVFLVIGSVLGFLYYLRYRRKKKAMERYAMKRMRRKFKRIQKEKL